MTTSANGSVAEIDVRLVAHHVLVGEAVATALSSRGVRAVESGGAVGLVVRDVDDPVQLHALAELIREDPLGWVLLTSSRDPSRWGAALDAGAAAVVSMSSGIGDVDRVLRAVAAGEPGMDPVLREQLVGAWHGLGEEHRQQVVRMGELTPRELTVLGLLAGGLSVARVAERLQVTEISVRGNVRSLMARLEVHSQLAAVAAFHRVVRRRHEPGPVLTEAGNGPR